MITLPAVSRRPREHRGEYSPRLAALGQFAIRHKALVIGAWLGAAVLLAVVFPQLETVVGKQSVQLLPDDVASFQSFDRMAAAFDERGAKTSIVVAMEDPAGLNPSAQQRYSGLVAALRADSEHVLMVQDLLADPTTRAQGVSEGGKAWFLPVGIAGTLGDPTAAEAIDAVRATVASAFAGTSTVAHVTGPPTTFHDQIATGERDAHVVSIATAVVIALILLLVYRSVFTALLPLLVIGISLAVARGILSALGEAGVPVSQFTITFLVAILLGAGTDYSVFLISRYHEQRRQGRDAEDAIVAATGSIGRVILASAATVALTFAAMAFARLSVFQGVGPACAVAVLIGFLATVTLLPPVLALAARRGVGDPRPDLSRRYWNRAAVAVVRRPWPLLAASLAVLLALCAAATTMKISYDDRAGQPSGTESNQGYQLLDRHFPKDAVISQFLLVQSKTDLRTAKSLADLDELASRISQVAGVTTVAGVTRPTGRRLDQAQLSWQNGRIGDKMAAAVADGRAHEDDLARLTSGADQLAAGLGQLDTTLRRALNPLAGILSRAQASTQTLENAQPLLRQLDSAAPSIDQALRNGAGLRPLAQQAATAVGVIEPLIAGLDASPWCATTPQCAQLRAETQVLVTLRNSGFFDQVADISGHFRQNASVADTVAGVQEAAATMRHTLAAVGDPADLAGNVRRLQDGVSRLASGAQTLATGVHTLADSNIQMLGGMSQIANQLQNSARATAGSDAASGFYLPSGTFDNHQFSDMAARFVSPDGRTVRFAITSSYDPFSAEAMALNRDIVDAANAARPNTSLADTEISVAGFPAVNSDLQQLLSADFTRLAAATLLIVGIVLVLLLRALVAPLYLLGTVVLNYVAALGLGVLVFQYWLGHDIAWPVPLLAFILLVAVGADYNMLLVSRLREESTTNMRVGVLRTVANTGSVITSAGVIFAASMFGLMLGSVDMMIQAGFVIGCGLLLDTFVVRTLTVPAIATLLREKSWWPQR
ncbi:RND family transporter [Mycolicibacterium chlorophenolicum]|uniref:Membrane transport protein mmpL8 n=1 Tax=Mycolicibacterium chlorophenolicum TaxID=37916 RepID=A0A0J6VL82_9MYCO|nr:RND family transporter [Mycolicibacterium chlorophenolicum]KMO70989.1 Membrane transport protein mmpL8 [Mycolicibacterium chlorophenolicum]